MGAVLKAEVFELYRFVDRTFFQGYPLLSRLQVPDVVVFSADGHPFLHPLTLCASSNSNRFKSLNSLESERNLS